MTAASPTEAPRVIEARESSNRWLHGPILDIALGCGGIYAGIVLLYWINAPALQSGLPEMYWPMLILLIIVILFPEFVLFLPRLITPQFL